MAVDGQGFDRHSSTSIEEKKEDHLESVANSKTITQCSKYLVRAKCARCGEIPKDEYENTLALKGLATY